MAIHFTTSEAKSLLGKFEARVSQKEAKGKITTWEITTVEGSAVSYYTHKSADWGKLAWFRPKIESNQLTFNIVNPEGKNVSTITYGYYHGHLLETFLNHFDDSFNNGYASARPEPADIVSAPKKA